MKLVAKLNVIAGVAAVCSVISLLGSWPMQWFGTGFVQTSVWFAGLALVPFSVLTFLFSIGMAIKRAPDYMHLF